MKKLGIHKANCSQKGKLQLFLCYEYAIESE